MEAALQKWRVWMLFKSFSAFSISLLSAAAFHLMKAGVPGFLVDNMLYDKNKVRIYNDTFFKSRYVSVSPLDIVRLHCLLHLKKHLIFIAAKLSVSHGSTRFFTSIHFNLQPWAKDWTQLQNQCAHTIRPWCSLGAKILSKLLNSVFGASIDVVILFIFV